MIRRAFSRFSIPLIYLFLAVYLLPMFPHGGSANELTRWATAASLIEKGSLEISWAEELIGKNVDTATVGKKTYSNKAPLPAILAAPFYALTRVFIGAPNASNIRISWFVMRFLIGTFPLICLALWLYRKNSDSLSLATLLFATPLFLYSLLFFSHVLVAVLIYFAFRLLYDERDVSRKRCIWAGVLSALAVLSEFPAIFAVIVLAGGLFFTERRERYGRVLAFIAGGLPFAGLLLIYNYSLFGSPLSFSYAHESFPEWAEVAHRGIFGLGFPTIANAFSLLLSPARGLFFYSPILILSVICFFTSSQRKTLRHKVKVWAIVISILVLCGHAAAHGGWAMGPRYLIFVLPLLLDSFFSGEADDFSNIWQGFLFTLSLLLCTIPALTFPFAPPEFRFPHANFWGPLLVNEHWFTPTLANVFGVPSTILTIAPVLVVLLIAIRAVCRQARRPERFAVGISAGFIGAGIYLFLPNLDNSEAQLRRASIAERFFKPTNRLLEIGKNAKARNDWKTLQRINAFEWTIADARASAPDDFPYLEVRELSKSPSLQMKKAALLQQQGKLIEAEAILQNGKSEFPFARCEFSTGLAVVYYATQRKEGALTELKDIQPLVDRASGTECLRSQFLLGSLYQEMNQGEDAREAFQKFLQNSERSDDEQIKLLRRGLGAK